MSDTENILGYRVTQVPSKPLSEEIFSALRSGSESYDCRWLACLNPHSYVIAKEDAEFTKALHDVNWLVPDGAGIVLASHLLSGNIRERVTGSDVFRDLHARMNATRGMGVFFLGSTPETIGRICRRMAKDYPNIRVAGTYSPPFKPAWSAKEVEAMINAINAAQADVLWVGMTAPKQEKWLYQNRHRLNVKFAAAVGAVFDFYAGNVKRSHPIYQRLGLEWLPRLIQQPRRLWRRMFVSAPVFLWDVIAQKFSR